MKTNTLAKAFRLRFLWIIGASLGATIITYCIAGYAWWWYAENNVFVPPANHDEQIVLQLEEQVKKDPNTFLSPQGKDILQRSASQGEVQYQVVAPNGQILYGNVTAPLLPRTADIYDLLNVPQAKNGHYIRTIPLVQGDGQLAGIAILQYQLKDISQYPKGYVMGIALAVILLSGFFYIIGFTIFFSRRFAKKLRQPLAELTAGAQCLQQQDLDFTISYRGNDEMGELCEAFRQMQHALSEALKKQWGLEQQQHEGVKAVTKELQTPLTLIAGYADTLAARPLSKEDADCVKGIQEAAAKSIAVVQQHIK